MYELAIKQRNNVFEVNFSVPHIGFLKDTVPMAPLMTRGPPNGNVITPTQLFAPSYKDISRGKLEVINKIKYFPIAQVPSDVV